MTKPAATQLKTNNMRNTALCFLLMLTTLSCVSQDSLLNNKPPKASFLKRSKDQNTGAWVLIAAGTGGLIATLSSDAAHNTGEAFGLVFSLGQYQPKYRSYTVAYVVSAVCVASGIYLFTAAAKNKRKWKATSVTIGMEETGVLKYNAVYKSSFPAVGIKIRIE
jgi:hypothetical protein